MTTPEITWAAIEQECGPYKQRFVATFDKYEGMTTDEKDAYGRAVKVTKSSFARHMGIDPTTFGTWIKRKMDSEFASKPAQQARTVAEHKKVAKNMAKANPSAIVDAIQAAGTAAEDQIFHELKLRRAGFDTSKANQKAAQATAAHIVKPFRQALANTKAALMLAALEEAAEDLRDVIDEGMFTDKLDGQIDKALEKFNNVRAEGIYAIS